MTTLDLKVARVVYEAHVLERAIHDPGPWWLVCGPYCSPMSRLITDEAIIFEGCLAVSGVLSWPLELRSGTETLLVRPVTSEEAEGESRTLNIRWMLSPYLTPETV